MKIVAIIPCFNEAINIGKLVVDLLADIPYFNETEPRELFRNFNNLRIRRFQFSLNLLVIARR